MSSLKAKERGCDVKAGDQQKRTAEGEPEENRVGTTGDRASILCRSNCPLRPGVEVTQEGQLT